nr:arylamine N-acetyltransferase [Streptomyces sp. Go40/10]
MRRLQKQHLMAIPYSIETVQASSDGIHLVELDEDTLFRTVVLEGRGGTCFQLNRLFCRLLSELGQDATPVAASTADGWHSWSWCSPGSPLSSVTPATTGPTPTRACSRSASTR